MRGLSVVLITLNEERNIDRCLNSVAWADEIIVVDSLSDDCTVAAARKHTRKVYQHEYDGSTRQMERGIGHAKRDWILLIDADEEVSPELAGEIREAVKRNDTRLAGYEILRKPFAFGRWIEHGGWYPDYQFRFFRKGRVSVNHQEVHGGFAPNGPAGRLHAPVYHYTYENIFAYVARMNEYTSLQVSNKLKADPAGKAGWQNLVFNPLSHFLRRFFVNGGYKDGFQGFLLAMLDATYTMILYAKLWEYRMQKRAGSAKLPPITNLELNWLKRRR